MTKKELLLQKALELFSRNGYQGTSTNLLARECGVSEGLIFRHFGSKEGLLKAVLEIGVQDIRSSLEPLRKKDKGLKDLIEYLHHFERLLVNNQEYWRMVSQLRFQQEIQQVTQQLMGSANQLILSSFGEIFQALGTSDKDQKSLLLFATLDGIALHFALFGKEYPIHEIIAELEKQLLTQYSTL
jgi:AcrR family transcriptional regulator